MNSVVTENETHVVMKKSRSAGPFESCISKKKLLTDEISQPNLVPSFVSVSAKQVPTPNDQFTVSITLSASGSRV